MVCLNIQFKLAGRFVLKPFNAYMYFHVSLKSLLYINVCFYWSTHTHRF